MIQSKRFNLLLVGLFVLVALPSGAAAQPQSTKSGATQTGESTLKAADSGLPLNFKRQTGDLDAAAKRSSIPALVLYTRSGFFYLEGRHAGIYYGALSKGSGCNGVGCGMCPGENYASD